MKPCRLRGSELLRVRSFWLPFSHQRGSSAEPQHCVSAATLNSWHCIHVKRRHTHCDLPALIPVAFMPTSLLELGRRSGKTLHLTPTVALAPLSESRFPGIILPAFKMPASPSSPHCRVSVTLGFPYLPLTRWIVVLTSSDDSSSSSRTLIKILGRVGCVLVFWGLLTTF